MEGMYKQDGPDPDIQTRADLWTSRAQVMQAAIPIECSENGSVNTPISSPFRSPSAAPLEHRAGKK